MMKNNKGQALVEFLLIIPILIFLILSIIDVSNIVISKYRLEDDMSTIVKYYEQGRLNDIENYALLNHLTVNYDDSTSHYMTIKINKEVSINTPGLNNIIGKKFKIESKRTIYYE